MRKNKMGITRINVCCRRMKAVWERAKGTCTTRQEKKSSIHIWFGSLKSGIKYCHYYPKTTYQANPNCFLFLCPSNTQHTATNQSLSLLISPIPFYFPFLLSFSISQIMLHSHLLQRTLGWSFPVVFKATRNKKHPILCQTRKQKQKINRSKSQKSFQISNGVKTFGIWHLILWVNDNKNSQDSVWQQRKRGKKIKSIEKLTLYKLFRIRNQLFPALNTPENNVFVSL